jgi:hypothetical protein
MSYVNKKRASDKIENVFLHLATFTCGTVIMTSGRSRSFNKAINHSTEIKSLAERK